LRISQFVAKVYTRKIGNKRNQLGIIGGSIMQKYRITYETKGGSGHATVEETKLHEVRATLENSGCFNIAVEPIYEEDPCEHCKRQDYTTCHGCPHAE
jgi:hypothetical protein